MTGPTDAAVLAALLVYAHFIVRMIWRVGEHIDRPPAEATGATIEVDFEGPDMRGLT